MTIKVGDVVEVKGFEEPRMTVEDIDEASDVAQLSWATPQGDVHRVRLPMTFLAPHGRTETLTEAAARVREAARKMAETGFAALLFATYANAAGWRTYDGKPIPEWSSLGPQVQACWIAVAKAVRTLFRKEG